MKIRINVIAQALGVLCQVLNMVLPWTKSEKWRATITAAVAAGQGCIGICAHYYYPDGEKCE